jgi:hypothetical protein
MPRGLEDRAPIDDAQRAIHAQPQSFEDGLLLAEQAAVNKADVVGVRSGT